MESVFVWTPADVIGMAFAAPFLLVFFVSMLLEGIKKRLERKKK